MRGLQRGQWAYDREEALRAKIRAKMRPAQLGVKIGLNAGNMVQTMAIEDLSKLEDELKLLKKVNDKDVKFSRSEQKRLMSHSKMPEGADMDRVAYHRALEDGLHPILPPRFYEAMIENSEDLLKRLIEAKENIDNGSNKKMYNRLSTLEDKAKSLSSSFTTHKDGFEERDGWSTWKRFKESIKNGTKFVLKEVKKGAEKVKEKFQDAVCPDVETSLTKLPKDKARKLVEEYLEENPEMNHHYDANEKDIETLLEELPVKDAYNVIEDFFKSLDLKTESFMIDALRKSIRERRKREEQ